MKVVFVMFLCLLFAFSIQAQLPIEEKKSIEVEKLTLGKEDSEGNIVEDFESLGVKDIPLYCYIDLSSGTPTLVNMKIVAVKAKRLRRNAQIVKVQYRTQKGENKVEFTASPGKVWAEGDYRVDIYLDGKLSKSKEFNVTKN